MRQPEQLLWDALRPKFDAAGFMAKRVENMVEEGFPDCFVKPPSAPAALLELKANPNPPKRMASLALGKKRGLRTEQRNWWLEYKMHSGRGWIVTSMGGVVFAHGPEHADNLNWMSYEHFQATAAAVGIDAVVALIGSAP